MSAKVNHEKDDSDNEHVYESDNDEGDNEHVDEVSEDDVDDDGKSQVGDVVIADSYVKLKTQIVDSLGIALLSEIPLVPLLGIIAEYYLLESLAVFRIAYRWLHSRFTSEFSCFNHKGRCWWQPYSKIHVADRLNHLFSDNLCYLCQIYVDLSNADPERYDPYTGESWKFFHKRQKFTPRFDMCHGCDRIFWTSIGGADVDYSYTIPDNSIKMFNFYGGRHGDILCFNCATFCGCQTSPKQVNFLMLKCNICHEDRCRLHEYEQKPIHCEPSMTQQKPIHCDPCMTLMRRGLEFNKILNSTSPTQSLIDYIHSSS